MNGVTQRKTSHCGWFISDILVKLVTTSHVKKWNMCYQYQGYKDPMCSLTEDGLAQDPTVRKQHLRVNKYNPPDISILCCKQIALGGIAVMVMFT